jgi:hypothetical protein
MKKAGTPRKTLNDFYRLSVFPACLIGDYPIRVVAVWLIAKTDTTLIYSNRTLYYYWRSK